MFYKIGITSISVKTRYSCYSNYVYKVLKEFYFEHEYCKAIEMKLIDEHRLLGLQYKFEENEKFSGYTECFYELNWDVVHKYLGVHCK